MSKSEDKIARLLEKNHIPYEREKVYHDLRNGKLRFDFYLPTMNVLLEYDSLLHFEQVKAFHPTAHDFKHAQENDRIKNSFVLAHDIHLYRIPFWKLDSLHDVPDLFQPEFLVKSRWHNDQIYRKYKTGG